VPLFYLLSIGSHAVEPPSNFHRYIFFSIQLPYFVTMLVYAAINSSLIQLIVSHICTFKNNYTPSSYLGLTSKLSESKELVKFRIGNHKLRIETGRYDQIPRVKRLCPISVSNQIEDESHFLIYCNQYSILRNKFY